MSDIVPTRRPKSMRVSRSQPAVAGDACQPMDVLSGGRGIFALEKRIAFDAAGAAAAAKTLRATTMFGPDATHHGEAASTLFGPAIRDTTPARDAQSAALGRSGLFGPAPAAPQDRSVVFIESDVADIPALVKDIDHSAQIVMLDATKDGVDAIASYLAAHTGVQNVYIFSHGSESNLDLGTGTLDATTMQGRYAADLATIKASLAPDANILVYGCDFAANADGNAAAHLLASLTGANVAASTNLTGGTAEGGDFVLEDQVGRVSAPAILATTIAADYDGLLAAQNTGAFTITTGTSGTAMSSATVATATTADGAVKIVVTVTPNANNSAGSITTNTAGTFDTTAPASAYTTSVNGAAALEETLQFGGTAGGSDGANTATIAIAYFDAKTGAAINVTNPVIDIDRIGGSAVNSSKTSVSNSSDLAIATTGATLTRLSGSSTAFTVSSSDIAETVNTALASGFSPDANADPTKGTSAGTVEVNGSYSTLTFNWSKAANSPNGGDRIDLIFSADTAVAPNGTLPSKAYADGQAGVSIATAQGFIDPSGLPTTYAASGLPAGLTINTTTGVISGTIDHDASKNAPATSGSGATLDGTYTVTVTASNDANNSSTQTFTIDSTNQAPVVGTKTADQSNSDGATITAVNAAAAFSDPNGDPLTYAATGLPAGLTISTAGSITGTVAKNAAPGTDSVTVTATDDKGAATAETFNWVIKDVPPASKGTLPNQATTDGQSGISIATSQGFTDSNGNALTYSASGLPVGLTINATTGAITGTIGHDASKNAPSTTGSGATLDGKYTVTVTADDGLGGTSAQTFTIDSINQAPVVGTKTATQTNSDGDTISAVNAAAAFSDPNGDPLTYAATGLPAGLSISTAGVITGTIAANATPGTDAVTVSATDDKGATTAETFSWVVKDVPPTASGTLANQAYTDGQAGVSIATSQGFADSNNNALTYSASGLPSGLTINATTGKITGTVRHDDSKNAPVTTGSGATLDGSYAVTVTAGDGLGGTATQTFTIDATNQAPIVGTKTANQSNSDGDTIAPLNAANAFTDPNGDPLTYAATGLPAGLSISTAGVITGTITGNAQPGTDTATVTATDDKGAATSETFTWVVKDVPPAANGTLANQTVTDGQAGVSFATAQGFADSNGNTLTYAASGLPAGLAINASTGTITGTVDHDASKNAPATTGSGATLDGKYSVVVTASDGLGGSTTQSFTIDSTNQAPTVGTRTPDQSTIDGATISPLDASKAFADPNGDPLTYGATGLPAGLTISTAGLVTGTVAGNAPPGTDAVTVTATDDKGAATTETFNWVVKEVPPTMSGTLPNQAYTDGQGGIAIATAQAFTDSNGNALTYTAGGLPAGLTINATTGQISGTLDHDASKNAPTTSGSGATLDGTYTVSVTASDPFGGTATQSFTIDSTNQAPNVGTATANQTSKDGQAVAAIATAGVFTDPNTGDVLTFSASNLPAGLTINPSTGVISGTVAANAAPGTYAVRVLATDDKGAASREAFTWTIQDVPPTTSGTLANQSFADSTAGIAISTAGAFSSPNGLGLTYRATGLPAGLSINPGTGAITGQLDHDASKNATTTSGSGATLDGTYTVVVTASDGQGGTAQQSFTIDATNNAPALGTVTADQHSSDGAQASVDAAAAFSDPNTGDVLTYGVSGLPAGLAINAATGLISGTIGKAASQNGAYVVTVTATDDKGAAASETFHWSVADVPPIATPPLPDQAAYDGTSISTPTANGFTNPNGLPLAYTAMGLPSGLSIDPTTGMISGTLNHDASVLAAGGVYTIAVTVNDGQGGSATNTFHLTASNQAPVVGTPTANQTSSDGQVIAPVAAGSAFGDPNGDPLTYAVSGLPNGLTIDPTSGSITGMVAANAKPGTTTVTVTATDDKGAATRETFTWTVDDVAPTSAAALPNRSYADSTGGISIATASAFSSPNGLPLSYSATGLPSGLTIDAATGTITGQLGHDASKNASATIGSGATLDGTYTVAVTASDGQGGTNTQSFTIDATNSAPTLVTQTADQHGADGASPSLDASAAFNDPNTGDVLTYAATGLPTGLGINAATGLISGTIGKSASLNGSYAVTVTATDDKGAAASETFQWQVDNVAPVATPPLADQAVHDGATLSLTTANGFTNPNSLPLAYSATGLPSGLSIDPSTGVISGMLNHDASAMVANGSYAVAVTVNDGQGGTATNTFHIIATNQAPVVGAPTANQAASDGQAVAALDASRAFADPNGDPLTYAASGLPSGLAIDPNTGRITGTVAANAQPGSYAVTVTATDDKGAATLETFTWSIDDTPPVASGTIANTAAPDGQAGISIATAAAFANPDGLPLTYTAAGLPAGLALNSQTGLITGTLDHDASANAPAETGMGATLAGTYTIAVTATDGRGGAATQTFTFQATNNAPVVGTATADQAGTDGNTASLNTAIAFSDPNAGDVLTYTASGLPAGLAINARSGMISGTIAADADTASPYAVTVTATDEKGAATSETFGWTIDPAPSAASPIPNLATYDGSQVSEDTSSHFDPGGATLAYTASGLPSGLAIDPMSGVISGTLDHDASANAPATSGSGATLDGTYAVSVTATGAGTAVTQVFTIDAANQAPTIATRTADQTGTTGQTIAALDASQAFADPNGDPLTYAAAGLPGGLAIDASSGKVTGTIAITAPGTYAVSVTATDDKGAATNETFAYTVADAAPQTAGTIAAHTYADATAGISVATVGAFTSPNGLALTYTAAGLPQGLTIDAATGVIAGTLDHDASANAPAKTGSGATLDGTYTIVVTASDGQGGMAAQSFTLDATNTAPVVATATSNQHSFDGNAASLDASAAFTDPNTGDILTYAATGLPTGLTIDSATGLIAGTIDKAASAQGPYSVTVTATDDKGAATSETFSWTVDDIVPVATPPLPDRSTNDGSSVALTTANGFTNPNNLPLTYVASGLPNGLAINSTTGMISGTLDSIASTEIAGGVYTIAVTANDGQGGSATNTFHLAVTNQAPVVVANTADQLSSDGQTIGALDASKAFVDPNGDALTYAASDLPAGLAIDPGTGRIAGTIAGGATPGTYHVTVTATDGKGGAAAETFDWVVNDVAPAKNGTLADVSFADSTGGVIIATGSSFVASSGDTLTYSATGLPPGLSIDPVTGTITGQLDHDASKGAPATTGAGATLDGTYTVVVSAFNGQGGTATQVFTIDATNTAPTIAAQTADQRGTDGGATSLDAAPAFADANTGDVLTYAAAGLPTGLAINPATGLISGTIDKSASVNGPYTVTVTATDDKGAATSETFAWRIDNVAPIATPPLADLAVYDGATLGLTTANGFTNPNNLPLTFTASGLPSGLTIDPTTGVISGTLDHDASILAPHGIYTLAVTADDGQGGSATNTFRLTATNQAPTVVARTVAQTANDGQTITPVDTSKVLIDPNGDPLTFAASNLPAGLAIDPATGLITGTVAGTVAPGTTTVTVTATDDKGAASLETFTWSIDDVPPTAIGTLAAQRFADSTNMVSIATAGGFASPNGLPLTFSASGLPKGLTIDPSTGLISGFINHDASKNAPVKSGSGATLNGTYTVTVAADDGQGGLAHQVFTIESSNEAPALGARTLNQSGVDGARVALAAGNAFADPNTGDVLTFTAQGLPKGLVIDGATGAITGTIDRSASVTGSYTVTVTATDDKGAASSETFAWTVSDAPPVAVSPGSPIDVGSLPDGSTISAFDTAPAFTDPNGLPLTYAATGLPRGLAIDPATGIVTGTLDHDASADAPVVSGAGATQVGSYDVVVTASDGQGGSASQTFAVRTSNQAPVVGARTADQQSSDGQTISVNAGQAFADPNGDPLTFAATGLPTGLAIDPATGTITGTIDPRASVYGPFAVTVTATDDKGASASEIFVWHVNDAPISAGTPVASVSVPDGSPIEPIDAGSLFSNPGGPPLTYNAVGLPAGLSIDPATGIIKGTLDHDASLNAPVTSGSGATLKGTYAVTVTASDGQGGSAMRSFAIVADNRAPVEFGTIADQTGQAGQTIVPIALASNFADPDGDPLVFRATGLPPGLALDPATGLLGGTIGSTAVAPAAYAVTIIATDDKGAEASGNFTFQVTPAQTSAAPVTSQPPVLPLASLVTADAFIPLATALDDTILNDARVQGSGLDDALIPAPRSSDIGPATPVLDALNLTSGDQEQSVVIQTDEIVISTVNNLRPLEGLQNLTTPGAGIVRSGAAANERGDRFDTTRAGFGHGVEDIDAPADMFGASLADTSLPNIGDGTAINIETTLRDRVLTVILDNRSTIACVVPVAHYTVTRADGRPLPAWLRLEAEGVVVGKVPSGVESIDLRITSTLRNGIVHERTVTIRTDNGMIRSQAPSHRAGRSLSDMVAMARPAPVAGRGLSRFLD